MKKGLIVFVLSFFSALFLLPLLFVLTGSLMGSREFASVYGSTSLRFFHGWLPCRNMGNCF